MRTRLFIVTTLLITALALVFSGTSAPALAQGSDIPAFVVEGSAANGIVAPEALPTGIVSVTFANTDETVPFSPIVARLNEDVTLDDFFAALDAGGPDAALPLVSLLGGTEIAPQRSFEIIFDLRAGTHVIIDINQVPPLLTVFAAADMGETEMVAAPAADANIGLVDFAFGMPEEIEAGAHLWRIENFGQQWHEMAVFRLADGITPEDALGMLMAMPPGPDAVPENSASEDTAADDAGAMAPPFEMTFFWAPIFPQEHAWVSLDLEPGTYLVVCFLPDLMDGEMNHLAHGMVHTLVVTEAEAE
ncbi:MAG: hypothetical protein JW910_11945 [Anaerolineae bacterium]|nr:hypothetical protein [Anaerolineae bacterium]